MNLGVSELGTSCGDNGESIGFFYVFGPVRSPEKL